MFSGHAKHYIHETRPGCSTLCQRVCYTEAMTTPENPAEQAKEDPLSDDAAARFAALMSGAADVAEPEAPYGYTKDRQTGEVRPKKSPGRGGVKASPSLEDLKASQSQQYKDTGVYTAPDKGEKTDRSPVQSFQRRHRKGNDKPDKPAKVIPPYREGVIAKGVNKLYAKIGRFVRVMDHDIGTAIIESTRKESDDDVTVGEAWDELARTNPRIRAFLMKLLVGGAWGQVMWAHAPIFLAIAMKEGISKHIPFMGLVEAALGDDEDGTPSDISQAMGGMTSEDMGAMMNMAQGMMAQMGMNLPRSASTGRMPGTAPTMEQWGDRQPTWDASQLEQE